MSSLSKTSFQEMTFLDEMIDQVIILDKSRNVCCANKSAFTRFGNDINGKNISLILRDAKLLESIDLAINNKKTQIVDIEIKLPNFEFYKANIIPGPKEYDLLNFFIKNPKRVYSREQILENVWSENINVENRTIDVHIRRLRQNINIIGVKELIRTVRSAGYSLN